MAEDLADEDIAALSFEDALARLTTVVEALEGGEVPLDRSIALYEQGEKLRRHCEARLSDAEMKVERITAAREGSHDGSRDGSAATEPFDAG